MAETTVKGFFDSLEARLNADPARLAGMNAAYQFQVGEETYSLVMKEDKASVSAGPRPGADCTVTMAEADFLDMLSGKLNGQMAFMTGKLRVAGDMGLALKLGSFLKG